MKRSAFALAALVAAACSQAQVTYQEDFSTDQTANWTYFSSIAGDTAGIGDLGGTANFFFDYTTVGIPVAPNGGDGHGLMMQANVRGTLVNGVAAQNGMSVAPTGQSFNGDYILRWDAWQNFQGPFPGGGNGTTQITMGGIGGTGLQYIGGPFNGFGAAATGDGGSASDYRMYNAPGATIGTYNAGSQNNSNAYYSSFVGTVPAAQTTYAVNSLGFNNQTGSTNVGALGMKWHRWELRKSGSTVEWYVDGLKIGQHVNATFGGSNIFFGYADTNASPSTDLVSDQLLFGLIDNVQVEAVPEPATMALLGLGGLALLRKRRR